MEISPYSYGVSFKPESVDKLVTFLNQKTLLAWVKENTQLLAKQNQTEIFSLLTLKLVQEGIYPEDYGLKNQMQHPVHDS